MLFDKTTGNSFFSQGKCPVCGSRDLSYDRLEYDEGGARGKVSCGQCSEAWGVGYVPSEIFDSEGYAYKKPGDDARDRALEKAALMHIAQVVYHQTGKVMAADGLVDDRGGDRVAAMTAIKETLAHIFSFTEAEIRDAAVRMLERVK